MKSQACVSCAKRKVRCDREEPCSNCERRKQECIFPETTPADRIKQLELLVRRLGGDPGGGPAEEQADKDSQASSETARSLGSSSIRAGAQVAASDKSQAPNPIESIIMQTREQTVYLEPFMYHTWDGTKHADQVASPDQQTFRRAPSLSPLGSDALQSVIKSFEGVHLTAKLPTGRGADLLWTQFRRSVQPLLKILFDWEVDGLQAAASSDVDELDPRRYALIASAYFCSVVSMSEENCLRSLGQAQSAIVSELQTICEQALARCEFMWAADVPTIQALAMYLNAGWDRFHAKCLWSLQGLAVRSAERLGLHRDGTMFGLSPVETERRRRLWWHLQQLDFGMTTRASAMSLTLMADWDVQLPLNIEDSDLRPDATELPKQRKGLTSKSHCLLVYWFIQNQRNLRTEDGTRLGLFWIADRSLSRAKRESLLDDVEEEMQRRFLQYCEPIKPVDVLIHLLGRAFLITMRRAVLHSVAQEKGMEHDDALWEDLLNVCIRCIEYNMSLLSNTMIEPFRWRMENHFQWSALLEAGHRRDSARASEIWELLSRLYSTIPSLLLLREDQRRFYAAEMIVALWKAHEGLLPERPALVATLETQLLAARPYLQPDGGATHAKRKRKRKSDLGRPAPTRPWTQPKGDQASNKAATSTPQDELALDQMFPLSELDDITGLQFDDIDWTFWDNFGGQAAQ